MLSFESKILIDVFSWIVIPSLLLFMLIYFSLNKSLNFTKETKIIISLIIVSISSISFFDYINPYANPSTPFFNILLITSLYSFILAFIIFFLLRFFGKVPLKITHKISKFATFLSIILLIWILGSVFNLFSSWYFLHSILGDNMLIISSALLSFSLVFAYITRNY